MIWRWTPDGEYSTKSALLVQFAGRFSKIKITHIWKAKAEPKCRFFAWTLLHKKILTANNLLKRGWTDETDCRLCGNDLETPVHLCKDCPFTKEVWEILKQWFQLTAMQSVNISGSLHSFWWRCRRRFDKKERRNVDGIFVYFWWNIWKRGTGGNSSGRHSILHKWPLYAEMILCNTGLPWRQGQSLLNLKASVVPFFFSFSSLFHICRRML